MSLPLCQKGDKDIILEEEFDFKGIEDEEDEEFYADMERNSAEEDKGEEKPCF